MTNHYHGSGTCRPHKQGNPMGFVEPFIHKVLHHCGFPNQDIQKAQQSLHEGYVPVPHDLKEEADAYHIIVPLPGFAKDDLKVSIQDNLLLLEGSRGGEFRVGEKETPEKSEPSPKNCESFFRMFGFAEPWKCDDIKVAIPLPGNLSPNETKISAKLVRGLLRVTIPKLPKKEINLYE